MLGTNDEDHYRDCHTAAEILVRVKLHLEREGSERGYRGGDGMEISDSILESLE